jgi:hypothetical protein
MGVAVVTGAFGVELNLGLKWVLELEWALEVFSDSDCDCDCDCEWGCNGKPQSTGRRTVIATPTRVVAVVVICPLRKNVV